MIRRPPRSTPLYSSAASDVYKRQVYAFTVRLHSSPARCRRRAVYAFTARLHCSPTRYYGCAVYVFTVRLHCSSTRYYGRAVSVFAARLNYPLARCSTTTAVRCTPSQYACTPAANRNYRSPSSSPISSTVHLQFIYCSTTVHRLHLLFIFCSSATVICYCGAPLMSSATLGRCSYCVRHRSFLISCLLYTSDAADE